MKRNVFAVILILLVFLLFGCDNSSKVPEREPETEEESEKPTEQEPLKPDTGVADSASYLAYYSSVDSKSLISLSDLNPNALYSIYVEGESTVSNRAAGSPALHSTTVGTNLFFPDENGNFEISGSELGISEKGIVKVKELYKTYDDMKIEEANDPYVDVILDGEPHKLYEEYYIVDLEEYKEKYGVDLSEVAVLDINTGAGSGNTDIGILTDFKDIEDGFDSQKALSLLDISGNRFIGLYNSMAVRDSSTPWTKEMRLVNPIDLTEEDQVIEDSACVYRIKPTGNDFEYVIEISAGENMRRGAYAIVHDNGSPRYYNGLRRKYLFPMNYSKDSILLYVGKVDEPFIFDFYIVDDRINSDYGSIKIRQISDDEKTNIKEVYVESKDSVVINSIKVTPDSHAIIPIKVKAPSDDILSGLEVKLECNDPECKDFEQDVRLVTLSGHTHGIGFSKRDLYLNDGTSIIIERNCVLEYCYLDIYFPQKEHDLKISFSPLR